MFVRCEYVKHRQLIVNVVFIQNRVENPHVTDPTLPFKDRIQKVLCDIRMLGTPQHQFESKINRWADAYSHTQRDQPPFNCDLSVVTYSIFG